MLMIDLFARATRTQNNQTHQPHLLLYSSGRRASSASMVDCIHGPTFPRGLGGSDRICRLGLRNVEDELPMWYPAFR